MAKKIIGVLLFVVLVTGGIFAQEGEVQEEQVQEEQSQEKTADSQGLWGGAKNFVSGEVGLVTAGARYERLLTPNISIGGVFYWNTFFIIFNELEIGAFGRYYIYKGLYAELGLGFHIHTGTMKYTYSYIDEYGVNVTGETEWFGARTGFAISPGLGWKFDPGKPGGFFLAPGFSVPITFGKAADYYYFGQDTKPKSIVSAGFVLYCSLGYAW